MKSELLAGSEKLEGMLFSFTSGYFNIDVDLVNITPFKSDYGFGEHRHSIFEFHYIAEGKGIVGIEDKIYNLEKGDFYITGPGISHWQRGAKIDPMVEYCLRATISLLKNNSERNDKTSNSLYTDYNQILNVLMYDSNRITKNNYDIQAIFENIFLEAFNKKIGYFNYIQNLIINLIFTVSRNYSDLNSNYTSKSMTINEYRFYMIKNYIDDNLVKNITCDELAEQVFISKRHLARIVKEQTGDTVHQYVQKIRVKRTLDYLSNTSKTLSQITELTGFANEFHLSRVVKQVTGKSPTYHRKQNDFKINL